ncbi:HipA family kinase [Reinekea marinisedimentorum]|uniref:HipA-like kinase domain-containing protein n=1 Tax=Reinekea marinisedimentorum TaxID=230495 RepID=A0A4R3HT40_9GAMM|nr:HipA family kinase [Reinekea marinisedimentorum]TCS36138.1 hypothetical protein BCF53_12720 [Reinekea marinisedimentorum]
MDSPEYLDIEQIIKPSIQGMSGVFYCKAEDGNNYWVKGHNVGRIDQIKEWLCGHLAIAFGLPIAPFCIASIDEYLVTNLPSQMKVIGYGPVFASKDVGPSATWFGAESNAELVPENLRRELLLFDYWIFNSDRQFHNPNLLWESQSDTMIVIDHNLAFDCDLEESVLIDCHIFTDVDREPFRDLSTRCDLISRMDSAIDSIEAKIHKIPEEWSWSDLEQTRPTGLELNVLLTKLKRYKGNEAFWSVL